MSNLWPQALFIFAIILLRFLIQRYNNSQPKAKVLTASGKQGKKER